MHILQTGIPRFYLLFHLVPFQSTFCQKLFPEHETNDISFILYSVLLHFPFYRKAIIHIFKILLPSFQFHSKFHFIAFVFNSNLSGEGSLFSVLNNALWCVNSNFQNSPAKINSGSWNSLIIRLPLISRSSYADRKKYCK